MNISFKRNIYYFIIIFLIYFLILNYLLLNNSINTIIVILFNISSLILLFSIVFNLSKLYRNHRYLIKQINEILKNFKRGNYKVFYKDSYLPVYSNIIDELKLIGKHFETIINHQNEELKELNELYKNLLYSANSYILILNMDNQVIFSNESFINKFNMSKLDVYNKKIDDIFYFLTNTIPDTIEEVKKTKSTKVVEKTQLISKNKISIIANIKISYNTLKNQSQIIMAIDDITSKCKQDYQISLLTRISEQIHQDEYLDHVLRVILTTVTSGSGLGFNRAMLYLFDRENKILKGTMAIGPDTFEEAMEIWSSIDKNLDTDIIIDKKQNYDNHGKLLMQKVLNSSFDLEQNNIFNYVFETKKPLHVHSALNNPSVDKDLLDLIDCAEFVIVPLIALNKPVGILIVDNKFNQMPITYENIELLTFFAFQAAISIESFNKLEYLQGEMEKLQNRQQAIVETEKLAAIGRIASHIAHEIRNPLVTIGGYTRRTLQRVENNDFSQDSISKALSIIMHETERLEKILSNVMDFTRESPFILKFNNINEIINDTVSLLNNLFQERRVQLNLKLEEVPFVKSDFNQMKQVLINLLNNALDATDPYGFITIHSYSDNQFVYVDIADSGKGIPSDDLDLIFEPFYTTKTTGVGLGLAIVKKIINDHKGEIEVSNLERGTCFTIKLPLP